MYIVEKVRKNNSGDCCLLPKKYPTVSAILEYLSQNATVGYEYRILEVSITKAIYVADDRGD